ncbi:MAG: GAF domain-containing protein [Planctomycetes bacterium]|nr:GAF domain-containing protein [Planctomycetota bacterium]
MLHLVDDPSDTHLLQQELRAAGLRATVARVTTAATLREALAAGSFQVLVVDLPLAADVGPALLDEVATSWPQLAVVYRWGGAGDRIAEEPGTLVRQVRAALASNPERPQDRRDRQRLLAEAVRFRHAHLELVRDDLGDFAAALRKITATMADLLRVERVGYWEFRGDPPALHCIGGFTRSMGRHEQGAVLTAGVDYFRSLAASLSLATADAEHDPRTHALVADYLRPLGITALLDAPVRRDGRVVGVLCHEHTGVEPRVWSLLEECAATRAAGLVARALEVRDRRDLQQRIVRLEQLDAIGDVARGVAHDMNNALTVLQGNLDELQAGTDPAHGEALSATRHATAALRDLVRALGTVGRCDALVLAPVDLAAWLPAELAVIENGLGVRGGVRATVPAVPVPVQADRAALARVLLNLVKNAVESTPAGAAPRIEVALTVARGEAAVPGLDGRSCARLEVRDHGTGIAPAIRARLFQPMVSTKAVGAGPRGMGLATSFALVRQHGGTITADSDGRGSTFRVWLPLAVAASPTR